MCISLFLYLYCYRSRNKSIGQQLLEVAQVLGDIVLLFLQMFYSLGECVYRFIVPIQPKPVKGEIVLV
jgi:hypothetical protein